MDNRDIAIQFVRDSEVLPGVTKAVALNLLMFGKEDEAMDYLLGVRDALAATGAPNHRAVNLLRTKVRDIIRGY